MYLKIQMSQKNVQPKSCTFSKDLEWAKIVHIPGVKPDQRLAANSIVNRITYKTLSQDKLSLEIQLLASTRPKRQVKYSGPVNITWKKTLEIIPEQSITVNLQYIAVRPKYLSGIKKIKQINTNHSKVFAKTITNRIALKGKIFLEIEYLPIITSN